MIDGINGLDWQAKPCPFCGLQPRMHLHRFVTTGVRGRRNVRRILTKAYYDCQCGEAVTEWIDSLYDDKFRIVRHALEIAREAWNEGKFL